MNKKSFSYNKLDIYYDDLFEWLNHAVSLKKDYHVRNSINKLLLKLINKKDAKEKIDAIETYRNSNLRLLMNLASFQSMQHIKFKESPNIK